MSLFVNKLVVAIVEKCFHAEHHALFTNRITEMPFPRSLYLDNLGICTK